MAEYIVAIDVTQVRFPADASLTLRLLAQKTIVFSCTPFAAAYVLFGFAIRLADPTGINVSRQVEPTPTKFYRRDFEWVRIPFVAGFKMFRESMDGHFLCSLSQYATYDHHVSCLHIADVSSKLALRVHR